MFKFLMLQLSVSGAPAEAAPLIGGERLGVHHMHTIERPEESLGPVAPPSHSPGVHHGTVYGYVYGGPSASDRVDFDSVTHLAWHYVDMRADGTIFNESSWLTYGSAFVAEAHAAGVRVHLNLMPHPTTSATAGSKMRSVLGSATYRARAVAEMAALVDAVGADGVSIDFEGLGSSTRDEFVLFVQAMSDEVDEVIVATPLAGGSGYDYDELAAASDGLFIMGYDAHSADSNPGPVSMLQSSPLEGGGEWPVYSLQWSLNDYRVWGTPDNKIIMGLPLYGRAWPALSDAIPGSSGGASSDDAPTYISCPSRYLSTYGERYEPVGASAWTWTGSHQVWCDTYESLETKISWALDEGIQGVGFWEVGYAAGEVDFWSMVDDYTMTEGWSTGSGTPSDGGSVGDSCASDLTEVMDCAGVCWSWETLWTAVADGVCDDGSSGMNLDCAEFGYDMGACTESDDSECVVADGKWCDGTRVGTCEDGEFLGLGDCAYYGATCEESGGWAYCVDWRCPDGESTGTGCVGTEIHACEEGMYSTGDCALYGSTCGEDSEGSWCMDARCEAGPHSSFCVDSATVGSCDVGAYTAESCAADYTCEESSDESASCVAADSDGDGTADSIDCDPGDASIFPGADEYCDGVDNDCDGVVDEASAIDVSFWYIDVDGDGYGDPAVLHVACDAPSGFVALPTDCDSTDPGIHPGAAELCDAIDSDCDGDLVDGFPDADGDGVPECDEADTDTDTDADTEEFEGDEAGECADGADNDRDGLFDCNDPDCAGSPDCAEVEASDTGTDVAGSQESDKTGCSCSTSTPPAGWLCVLSLLGLSARRRQGDRFSLRG